MRLRKLGAALVVVAAFGAVLASSAFAAATTTDVKWYTGASPGTELSGSESVSGELGSSGATWEQTVAGVRYVWEAKKFTFSETKIENSGGVAVGEGHMTWEDVTLEEPAGCTIPEKITTKSLTMTADWMSGSTNYIKFVPTAGETTAWATIEVTGCPDATNIVPKGSLFVESQNSTGTQAVSQEVHSSAAINAAAGGSLHVGTETSAILGSFILKMSGAKAGTAFGTH